MGAPNNKAKPKRVRCSATENPCRSRISRDVLTSHRPEYHYSVGWLFPISLVHEMMRYDMKVWRCTSWLIRGSIFRGSGSGILWVPASRTTKSPFQIISRRYQTSISAAELQFGQPLYETHPHLLKAGECKEFVTTSIQTLTDQSDTWHYCC